jgi:hypothetical protein
MRLADTLRYKRWRYFDEFAAVVAKTEGAALRMDASELNLEQSFLHQMLMTTRPKGQGVITLGTWSACNRRGGSGWQSVSCIDASRAGMMVGWCGQTNSTLSADVSHGDRS